MKYLILITFLFTVNVQAADFQLKCVASYNANKILETDVELNNLEQDKTFGKFDEFEFVISSKANHVFELQFVDIYGQARSYATAMLLNSQTYVELSLWTRDMLMETRCTLK